MSKTWKKKVSDSEKKIVSNTYTDKGGLTSGIWRRLCITVSLSYTGSKKFVWSSGFLKHCSKWCRGNSRLWGSLQTRTYLSGKGGNRGKPRYPSHSWNKQQTFKSLSKWKPNLKLKTPQQAIILLASIGRSSRISTDPRIGFDIRFFIGTFFVVPWLASCLLATILTW